MSRDQESIFDITESIHIFIAPKTYPSELSQYCG